MSIVSNRHNVLAFVAGKSQALTGQRLAKQTYKQTDKMTKAGIKALPAICASVPTLDVLSAAVLQEFEPHVRALIEDTQDKLIGSMYEGKKVKIGDSISDEDIGIDAVLEFLNQSGAGHLSGEKIGEWYDLAFASIVEAFTIEKLTAAGRVNADTPVEEYPDTINNIIKATVARYKDTFKSLAGKNVKLEEKECKLCLQLLSVLDADDDADNIGARLTKRVQKMMQPVIVEVPADALDLAD
jgi:hypothetical protein